MIEGESVSYIGFYLPQKFQISFSLVHTIPKNTLMVQILRFQSNVVRIAKKIQINMIDNLSHFVMTSKITFVICFDHVGSNLVSGC